MRYTKTVKTIRSRCHQLLVKLLTAERKKAGIPQTLLAKQLHEKQNWVSRLENGQRRVDVCEFLILAKFIGFDPVKALRQIVKSNSQPPKTVAAGRRKPLRRSSRGGA